MKPTRPFIYLSLVMVFLFVLGMLVVSILIPDLLNGRVEPSLYMTSSAIMATNSEVAMLLAQTATNSTATFTPIPYDASMSPTALPVFTSTPAAATFRQCAYSWARRNLPQVTALARAALDSAQITGTSIRVEAYGEECIDQTTNTVQGFGAMTTDFYLTMSVTDLSNADDLAGRVIAVKNPCSICRRKNYPHVPNIWTSPLNQPVNPGAFARLSTSLNRRWMTTSLAQIYWMPLAISLDP